MQEVYRQIWQGQDAQGQAQKILRRVTNPIQNKVGKQGRVKIPDIGDIPKG